LVEKLQTPHLAIYDNFLQAVAVFDEFLNIFEKGLTIWQTRLLVFAIIANHLKAPFRR